MNLVAVHFYDAIVASAEAGLVFESASRCLHIDTSTDEVNVRRLEYELVHSLSAKDDCLPISNA